MKPDKAVEDCRSVIGYIVFIQCFMSYLYLLLLCSHRMRDEGAVFDFHLDIARVILKGIFSVIQGGEG